MKRALHRVPGLAIFGVVLFLSAALSARADAPDQGIASRYADIDGVKLHYLIAGQGPAGVLLHGYTQTSRM